MLKLKLQYFGHLMRITDSLEKTLMLGKIECGEGDDRGWDGWIDHQLVGHEFKQAPGVGDGQGSLACCSPWRHKKSDTTNWTELSLSLSRGSSRPRNQTGVSCIAGVFFTSWATREAHKLLPHLGWIQAGYEKRCANWLSLASFSFDPKV